MQSLGYAALRLHSEQEMGKDRGGFPNTNMNRKLKMGMVGGGRGAFIGSVHRMFALKMVQISQLIRSKH
jgi:hypothetical protein